MESGENQVTSSKLEQLYDLIVSPPDKGLGENYESILKLGSLVDGNHIKVLPYKSSEYPLIEILDDKTEINVAPRQYAVAKYGDETKNRIIGTYCAGPCHIVSIYDKKNQQGCIIHADVQVLDFENSYNQIIANFSSAEALRINLFGGNNLSDSIRARKEIIETLRSSSLSLLNETNSGKVRSIG